jgi:uncharacterized membrane protein YbhN (UPF0104 family)
VLLAALLAATIVAIAGLIPGSGHRLEDAAPGWIAAEIALELIAIASYTALFQGVFSTRDHPLRLLRSGQIATAELGAFVVVPTGVGAPALRFWALMRGGHRFRTVMVRSVVHAVIFNLPYVGVALVLGSAAAIGVGPGHASVVVALAPLGLVAATIAIAVAATVYAGRRQTRPKTRWAAIGIDVVQAVPQGMRELPGALRRPWLLLAAIGFWAGDAGVLFVAFHAAHGSAPVAVVALAYMLGQLGNTLPLPGGVGGVEPIMLGVLTASGVGLGLGGAAVILYRLVSLGLQAATGAIAGMALFAALQRQDPAGPDPSVPVVAADA